MIDSTSPWVISKPLVTPSPDAATRLLGSVLPGHRVVDVRPLGGGLVNSMFTLHLDRPPDRLVLRVYDRDPVTCRKEVALLELVRETVPVPEIVHAEPEGAEGLGAFLLLRYVEGITLQQLKATRDPGSLLEAARAIGLAAGALGRHTFAAPGWLGPALSIGAPLMEGTDQGPRFVDACLASPNLARRTSPALRDRVHAFMWAWAPRLATVEPERRLVHGDLGARNVILRQVGGRWTLAAIIDWEFAVSGSPLMDVGHFLRYERPHRPRFEPAFSQAFVEGGGVLPDDWRPLSRAVDLPALCELLTRASMPDDIVVEIRGLIEGAVGNTELA